MQSIPESLGYTVVKLCKLYFNRLNVTLNALNIYEGQQNLLLALWKEDGLAQSEITRRLGVEAASVSKAVDRMENAGFVKKVLSPDDARMNHIFLTDLGRSMEKPVHDAWFTVEEELLAHMTLEERLLLRRLMLQMRDNLK
ncbi:MAG: MarR family transcriptional regulator [Anaerolineae bacterium]|nr:MarR family transcriptional regulator [Anaerolineae bacterium]